jgi:hypothetical protein
MGLSRGFQLAGAAAVVVSLWSVDDGSTAALMAQMYQNLVSKGCTVPQALRLAMLHLAQRETAPGEGGAAAGRAMRVLRLREEWKRPMHWAGFLVVGASTRLPRGAADEPREGREAEDERPDTGHIYQGQESDSGTRGWEPPKFETDFAKCAGLVEKEVLRTLNFSLLLEGQEIGGENRHGLTEQGFLTPDALKALGVHTNKYLDLWGNPHSRGKYGEVVTKAIKLLLDNWHSTEARHQVLCARDLLEWAVYYRQLDVMTWRFGRHKSAESNAKEAREKITEALLHRESKVECKRPCAQIRERLSKLLPRCCAGCFEGLCPLRCVCALPCRTRPVHPPSPCVCDILQEYIKDCTDPRPRTVSSTYSIKKGQCLTYSTPDCFKQDDPRHTAQLDACYKAMTELDLLLKCYSPQERERLKKTIAVSP